MIEILNPVIIMFMTAAMVCLCALFYFSISVLISFLSYVFTFIQKIKGFLYFFAMFLVIGIMSVFTYDCFNQMYIWLEIETSVYFWINYISTVAMIIISVVWMFIMMKK